MDGGNEALQRAFQQRRQERQRVKDLIRRDRDEAAREAMRVAADIEVGDGKMVNLVDTVLTPTPEWLAKGETQAYTPKAPDGTVRSVSTVRRVQTPVVVRMQRAGSLTDEHAMVCLWYRQQYEIGSLDGHSASSQWNPNSTIRRSAVDAGFGYVPTSHAVAEARDAFRAAQAAIPAFYVKFFEAVVLHDLPMRRAARFAKCRDDRAKRRFRDVAEQLHGHCASIRARLPKID